MSRKELVEKLIEVAKLDLPWARKKPLWEQVWDTYQRTRLVVGDAND